jgi:hypothetical protein
MRKNVAGQTVGFGMISSGDGETAVTGGSPTVYVTIDGGTQATGAGTSTHEGNGQWTYAATQAETNGNHVVFTMKLAGAITQTVNVYPLATDLQTTATPTVVASTVSDKAGYSLTAGTGLGNQTSNITGSLSGSVGSVTGAVGSVTAGVTVTTNNDKTGYSISGTITTLDALLTKLRKYFQLLFRSDAAVATDNATELTEINASGGSGAGDYNNQTDATEALADSLGGVSNALPSGKWTPPPS